MLAGGRRQEAVLILRHPPYLVTQGGAGVRRTSSWRPRQAHPLLAALSFLGAAALLAVCALAALDVAEARHAQPAPAIGWHAPGGGEVHVVQAQQGVSWDQLAIVTDVPAVVSGPTGLEHAHTGDVEALEEERDEPSSPTVRGGDVVGVCTPGGARSVEVRVLHEPSGSVLLRRNVVAPACPG